MSFIWNTDFVWVHRHQVCIQSDLSDRSRRDFDNEQHLQVQVQHEFRRDQEDSAQEADPGRGLQPARSHENRKTVQNFTNLSFHVSANYLEIILSDPVTHGENRLESHSYKLKLCWEVHF